MRKSVAKIRSFVKLRIRALTVTGVLVLLFTVIPDTAYWLPVAQRAGRCLYALAATTGGRLMLITLGLALILFDQRRISKKQKKEHDLSTLKGRTLKLRDDIYAFVSTGPTITSYQSTPENPSIKRVDVNLSRLKHGYCLRFETRLENIIHEFGELGLEDADLVAITAAKIRDVSTYKAIMKSLERLAQYPESMNTPRPLLKS